MQGKINNTFICIFFSLFISAVLSVSALTPPLQSPDENGHILRGYSLKRGEFVLDTVNNQTGVKTDTGLLAYIGLFSAIPFHYETKYTQQTRTQAKEIEFTRNNEFYGIPNIALYFPLSYLPHALALGTGKMLHISVNTTYFFMRFLSFLTVTLLLALSFKYQKPNWFVLTILFMPMCLFQFGSASIDGIQFALTVLIMSLFLHIWQEETDRQTDRQTDELNCRQLYLLGFLIFVLGTNRMNMAPLILLPCLLFYKFKDKRCLYTAVFSAAGILLWIGIAMTTVQVREPKMSDIIVYYLSHPADFFSILFHTLTNTGKLKGYRDSFIGILGWLDAPLPRTAVTILGCSLLIMFALNVRKMRQKFLPCALTATAIICLFSTFVILLVQWTKFPDAEEIEGIQGRYFIPVAIMLGYALCAETENKTRNYISAGLFFFFVLFSQIETINTLLLRYWLN